MHTSTRNRHRRSGSPVSRRRTFSNSAQQRGRFRSGHTFKRRVTVRNSGGGRRNRPARKMASFDPSRFINTNPVNRTPEVYAPKHSFNTFGLKPELVRTISRMGMVSPTPIQDKIIPEILENRDVIGLAETGTGKTAAFLIPLIENTLKEPGRQTLILAPTRELALQIEKELRDLSAEFRLHSVICVGGVNIYPQIKALRRANHFIIGTPGRILDLINRRKFTPSRVRAVVLDEADRMLDMGFIHDMKKILSAIPKNRETLLFSATMSKDTERLTHDFLRDPVIISVKKKDVIDSIEQDVIRHGHHDKFETLLRLLSDLDFKRVLVFGSMKHSVERLARQLQVKNIKAESIHGNKNHSQRQQALAKFKSGYARVLVATDVAARGIHVDGISHVINYDLPNTFEDYVHRIGRTGRASMRGKALTFVPARM